MAWRYFCPAWQSPGRPLFASEHRDRRQVLACKLGTKGTSCMSLTNRRLRPTGIDGEHVLVARSGRLSPFPTGTEAEELYQIKGLAGRAGTWHVVRYDAGQSGRVLRGCSAGWGPIRLLRPFFFFSSSYPQPPNIPSPPLPSPFSPSAHAHTTPLPKTRQRQPKYKLSHSFTAPSFSSLSPS